jgi:protein-disulfide isomerase
MFAVEPYWQHGGWKDLPTLPEGVDSKGLHWKGATQPLITIVEYSDYQCPYCRRAHRDTRILAGKFPNEIRLVHRHFPLDNACNTKMKRAFHEFACKFSRASACAADQDKFWEMNDALFSIQDTTKAADVNVETIAVELGLDRSKFLSCMSEKEVPGTILRDIAEGARLQIGGTPTYFINGQSFEGGVSEEVIAKMLANIRKARTKNTPDVK